MNKTVFVNRYFYPDHSATSQLLSELAFDLAEADPAIAVHVICCRQSYDDPTTRLAPLQKVGNVTIHRVWSSSFGRKVLAYRALDYITFYASSALRLASVLQKGDVVIAKTDPPLISVVVAAVAAIRRATLVNWIQDLFPEVAERLGVPLLGGKIGAVLRALRNASLRRAFVNVAVGERMADELIAVSAIDRERVRVIHNWADVNDISPIDTELTPYCRQWHLEGRFIVAYSGNMGRAHEFDTVIAAIEMSRADRSILFLFVGGGKQFDTLLAKVRDRGLEGAVQFRAYQPRTELKNTLGAAHVHLITLQPAMEGLIVPSKFYSIAAAGKPVIFVGDQAGEIGSLIAKHNCGFTIAPGDASGLSAAISELRESPSLQNTLGRNARQAAVENYDRRRAIKQWKEIIQLARSKGQPVPAHREWR